MAKENQVKQIKRVVARTQDYKQVFSSMAGERVLYDLMREANILNVSKKEDLEFNEGKRSIILKILSHLHTDEKSLIAHIKNIEGEKQHV